MREHFHHPIKQKAREKMGRFIKKNLIKTAGRNPRNIKVATFLGPPVKNESGDWRNAELEIYDSLHIPRENVYTMERRKDRAKLIYDSGLIPKENVFLGADIDFFRRTADRFGVINLDYEGYLDEKKQGTLMTITGRQILDEKSILATWFLGARERSSEREFYEYFLRYFMEAQLDQVKGLIRCGQNETNHCCETKKKILELDERIQRIAKDSANNYTNFKKTIVSEIIDYILLSGMDLYRTNPLIAKDPEYEHFRTHVKSLSGPIIQYRREFLKRVFPEKTELEIDEIVTQNNARTFYKNILNISNNLSRNRYSDFWLINFWLPQFLHTFYNKSYFTEASSYYEYRNEYGKTMFIDMRSLNQRTRFFDKFKELAECIWSPHVPSQYEIFQALVGKDCRKVKTKKELDLLLDKVDILRKINTVSHIADERIYLGSSHKPKLTQKEYFLRVKEGYTDDQLKEAFTVDDKTLERYRKNLANNGRTGIGYLTDDILKQELAGGKSWNDIKVLYKIKKADKRHFAAIAAHHTMGTYNKQEIPQAVTELSSVEVEQPPIFDKDSFMETLYYTIIDRKYESGIPTEVSNTVLDFCSHLTNSQLSEEQKQHFLGAIKDTANGKPLNRLTRTMSYSHADKFIAGLQVYVDQGIVPTSKDILNAFNRYK
jgi:hypothetical protein